MKENLLQRSRRNRAAIDPDVGYDHKLTPRSPLLWKEALRIQNESIVIDGHNDIACAIYDFGYDIASSGNASFHTDLSRMIQGGISAQFFSIFVDGEFARKGGAIRRALNLVDSVYSTVESNPNYLQMAYCVEDIVSAKKVGKIAALLGIEGGHAIEDSLQTLRLFYRLGVRYMTLTHVNTNSWADSSLDENKFDGLNGFGKEVVREMNRLGMLVDVSHVSDKTMSDVLNISSSPVIASHSCCWSLSNHPRNINDDLLRKMKLNRGLVMVNFHSPFICQRYWDEVRKREKELSPDSPSLHKPTFKRIVDHIDHIVNVAGMDHVGIGSDFDGGIDLPLGLTGVNDLPMLTYEMLIRGYSETDIKKVLGGNFLRVLSEVEKQVKTKGRKISSGGSLVTNPSAQICTDSD